MEFPLISRIPGADAFCIALVILPICIVPTVISERFRPVTYPAREQPPVVVKLQDRITKEKS